MKTLIKSREAIEKMSVRQFPKGTLLISITDVGDADVNLQYEPEYILRREFDDVDNDVVRVIISMMGRETPIELGLDQVETALD